jgi:membrane associated rhomboid family serine protease
VGIYDRDYYREEEASEASSVRFPQTTVMRLVMLNAALYLADLLFGGREHAVTSFLALHREDASLPWYWWRTLSYAFAHNPFSLQHIGFNMLGLWMFGREVEPLFGRWEFLRFYLAAALVGGVAWLVRVVGFGGEGGVLLGASGAVVATVILFAMRFPHRQVLFMMVIPMPAWVMALIYVGFDVLGSLSYSKQAIAYDVHLAGAAFGFLYCRLGLNFGRFSPSLPQWLRRPRWRAVSPRERGASEESDPRGAGVPREELRLYRPEPSDPQWADLDQKADAVLAKLHEFGDQSLTAEERAVLEAYSRRMRQRRR